MIRIVLVLLMLLLLGVAAQHLGRQPKERRRALMLKYGLFALIGALALLVVTGRVHWIGLAIAALLPVLGKLSAVLIRLLPFLSVWLQRRRPAATSGKAHENPSPSDAGMTRAEALQILGLGETATESMIIERHRALILKMHPDRGGSDYLAARINLAKDTLLNSGAQR